MVWRRGSRGRKVQYHKARIRRTGQKTRRNYVKEGHLLRHMVVGEVDEKTFFVNLQTNQYSQVRINISA
jgi:hypothetical protein